MSITGEVGEIMETPRFVLMEGNRRIGPHVAPSPSGRDCSTIYGFSHKTPYEKFRANSTLSLTPYPLVKFYLRDQVGGPENKLRLVVVDASGPSEPVLRAATMEAVLEAQENGTTRVSTRHRLNFDADISAYRLEESNPA